MLLNEHARGAVHPGGAGKRSRHDLARLPRRLERPSLDLAPQRLKQLVARLRDSPADHHDFRVEDINEAGDRRAEQRRGRAHALAQPRFGVRSTTPVLVLRGPGEPIPTPSIFLPDSAIDALASLMMRAVTASAPCAAIVGSETTP